MTMKRVLFTSIGLLFMSIHFIFGQDIKDPDIFLVPNKDDLPKVFLVGTFHFEYYNADAYKVDQSKQIDILSDQKQKEVKELLEYIAIFKPTKICIEAFDGGRIMNKYRLYRQGKKSLAKDEIEQLGFRLMDKFNLDTIYSIDAKTIADELPESKDSLVIRPYFDKMFDNYSFKSNANYKRLYEYQTELSLKLSLLNYFKYLNSPKSFERDYGAYLVGDFKNGKYDGADALTTYWYNRNLRIFRNIQNITTSPDDRILVLFGAGHITLLDQYLRSSPEYDYIKFNDLKE